MMSRDYRKLRVFRSAQSLALMVYESTRLFPNEELFGATNQLRRAALSVPTNSVEGSHRTSRGDCLRFLDVAMGSLAETGYLIDFAASLGHLPQDKRDNLLAQ
ncbi:MAG: four helix bundle protein [Calditrichaeota bacterium]|nr:four helix bundle protein [Calditrichota bacterium]